MQPSPAENSYWNNYDQKGRNWKNRSRNNYDQNDGKPGVVYILANDAFPHLLKIGQSTRSAAVRAQELNDNCGTESPGRFSILHEIRTVDCGRAEKRAHSKLKEYRFKKGKEFFKVDVNTALSAVREACAFFNDKKKREKQQKEFNRKIEPSEVNIDEKSAEEADAHAKMLEQVERFRTESATKDKKQNENKSTPHTTSTSETENNIVVNCSRCNQSLQISNRSGLVFTCPSCRHVLKRSPYGIISLGPDYPNKESTSYTKHTQPKKVKSSAYFFIFAALVIGWIIFSASESNKLEKSAMPYSEEAIAQYAKFFTENYKITTPEKNSETNLDSVSYSEKAIKFRYTTTYQGEKALSNNLDKKFIQNGMQQLACAKPQLKYLIKKGVMVSYELQTKEHGLISTTIKCD